MDAPGSLPSEPSLHVTWFETIMLSSCGSTTEMTVLILIYGLLDKLLLPGIRYRHTVVELWYFTKESVKSQKDASLRSVRL